MPYNARNGIIGKIDVALSDPDTPRWAVPILLCLRDDHCKLHEHLAAHQRWADPVRQVIISVVTALAVGGVFWLAVERFGG